MKVGLVGAGFVARNYHLPSLSIIDRAHVVAICDPNKKALNLAGNEYHIKKRYSDMSDMLKSQDFDMIDITTPGFMHYEQCLLAIERGVHVLVEKPVALSVRQAEELNTKSKNKGVKVCVMQNYRFRDPLITFKRLQKEGKIGDIISMATFHHGGSVFAQPSWLWDEKTSGGILYENAVQSVDLHAWLMGEHKRVIGITSTYNESFNLTTSIQALVEHKNGSIGFLDLQWFASSILFWTNVFASIRDVTIKLQPDSISLQSGELSPLSEVLSEIRRVYDFGKLVLTRKFKRASIRPHLRVISEFVRSLESETKAPVTIDDVMPTMRLLDKLKNKMTQTRH